MPIPQRADPWAAISAIQAARDMVYALHAAAPSFWRRRAYWKIAQRLDEASERLIAECQDHPTSGLRDTR